MNVTALSELNRVAVFKLALDRGEIIPSFHDIGG